MPDVQFIVTLTKDGRRAMQRAAVLDDATTHATINRALEVYEILLRLAHSPGTRARLDVGPPGIHVSLLSHEPDEAGIGVL